MIFVDRLAIGVWFLVTIPLLLISDTPKEALGMAIFTGIYAFGFWGILRTGRFVVTGRLR